jgi:dienelactone hydrolase
MPRTAAANLDKYKKKYEIKMYAGAGHAFLNNPQSRNTADRDAAEKSVAATTNWLRKALAQPTLQTKEVHRGKQVGRA